MDLADNVHRFCRTFATREHRGCRPRRNGYPMTQPVLFKQSFLIAVLAGIQAVMPAVGAVASLYATIIFFGIAFNPPSQAIIIVAVLRLILVQPPREVNTQLTSARISPGTARVFCWLRRL